MLARSPTLHCAASSPLFTTHFARQLPGQHQRILAEQTAVTATAAAAGSGGTSGGSTASSDSDGPSPPAGVHTVEYRGRKLQAAHGTTLRTAMLEAGVTPHNGRATLINCRGLGTCGTCAVQIDGSVEPVEWNAQERLRLNFPPHSAPGNQRLRLACQVACQGDLRVVKRDGFWGQGEQVLPDLGSSSGQEPAAAEAAAAAPLGQLEFILDRQRQRQRQQQQQQGPQ